MLRSRAFGAPGSRGVGSIDQSVKSDIEGLDSDRWQNWKRRREKECRMGREESAFQWPVLLCSALLRNYCHESRCARASTRRAQSTQHINRKVKIPPAMKEEGAVERMMRGATQDRCRCKLAMVDVVGRWMKSPLTLTARKAAPVDFLRAAAKAERRGERALESEEASVQRRALLGALGSTQ